MKNNLKSIFAKSIYTILLGTLLIFSISSCENQPAQDKQEKTIDKTEALSKMKSVKSPQILEMMEDVTSLGFGDENTPMDSLKKAMELFQVGSIDSARVAFESYLVQYPDDEVASFFNGLCQFEKGKYSRAIEIIQPLLKNGAFEYKDSATYYLAMAYFGLDGGQGDDLAKKHFSMLAADKTSHYQKEAKTYIEQFF